jgi:hypothetical protein
MDGSWDTVIMVSEAPPRLMNLAPPLEVGGKKVPPHRAFRASSDYWNRAMSDYPRAKVTGVLVMMRDLMGVTSASDSNWSAGASGCSKKLL